MSLGQAPLRVLVVDDHPDTRSTLGMLLTLWGHEVREAADGEEALRAAWFKPGFRPQVVFLDLAMPRVDGRPGGGAPAAGERPVPGTGGADRPRGAGLRGGRPRRGFRPLPRQAMSARQNPLAHWSAAARRSGEASGSSAHSARGPVTTPDDGAGHAGKGGGPTRMAARGSGRPRLRRPLSSTHPPPSPQSAYEVSDQPPPPARRDRH
jgi:hypothetical protein